MNMRVSRMVYVLVAAALAVGLVTSILVQPSPTLAADGTCYGACPSTTSLSLSRTSVTYGQEQAVRFRVQVHADGVPTGLVVVKSRARLLCWVRLHHGTGNCSPGPKALRPGSYRVVAYYGGDANFERSLSGYRKLTVAKRLTFRSHPTTTHLRLSRARVIYGREHAVRFSVRVRAGARSIGVPTGLVVVRSGGRVLCRIHLHRGAGTCSPRAKALGPGRHRIVAHYRGDRKFRPSTSSAKTLLVRRR